MSKVKRSAAIYIRVSTREQANEGYSLDAQKRVLLDYCKLKKYDIYKIYSDKGISAKDIEHRPGIKELLNDAKDSKFSIILVWKLTRFSRNMANLMTVCEILDCIGVSLVSYTEAFDSQTPAGRMVRSMLGIIAQFEREVISENVGMGLLERATQGKRTCSSVLGYDVYGKDSLIINSEEAKYVNFVHDTYLERKSITEVVDLARREGFKGKRGAYPTLGVVRKILTNPVYAGYNLFHGQIYKGDYNPIRTAQQFNKVQQLLARQGKNIGRTRKSKLYMVPNIDR